MHTAHPPRPRTAPAPPVTSAARPARSVPPPVTDPAAPLFRPDALRKPLAAFDPPPVAPADAAELARWGELVASGEARTLGEQEILRDWLDVLFRRLLGYARPQDDAADYRLRYEVHVGSRAARADGSLGLYGSAADPGPGGPHRVALEGKGPTDPLDRPHGGRKQSAVDQALGYAFDLRCDWFVVTNVAETRLYHVGRGRGRFERWATPDLAADPRALRRLRFLLNAGRVCAPGGCGLDDLLTASDAVGRRVTGEFYRHFAAARRAVFADLRDANPGRDPAGLLAVTQTLLDRVLFVAFCEDRGLLPADSLKRAFEHADPYHPRPVWENFRALFRAVNDGSSALGIPAYNGGLFAPDPALDGLDVPDAVCRRFAVLGRYEYRPPRPEDAEPAPREPEAREPEAQARPSAPDDESTRDEPIPDEPPELVDVEILGHVFEQSLDDLEDLRRQVEEDPAAVAADPPGKRKTRRRSEGAFYTPAFVTAAILDRTLGVTLAERFDTLRDAHVAGLPAGSPSRTALGDPRAADPATLKPKQRADLAAFWEAWERDLTTLKVVDPACGSGAFLVAAFDRLADAYRECDRHLRTLAAGPRELAFDIDREVLRRNLYGVDLNGEAVEVCRLSLWIKTAERGKPLTTLADRVRPGDSLTALDWRATFPEAFEGNGKEDGGGGFDVVLGNPPYVRQEWITEQKPALKERYASYDGAADLYVYFFERALDLLRPGGRLGYVVTNKWLRAGYAENLRGVLTDESAAWVEGVVDFGHAKQVFPDADVFPSLLFARKPLEHSPPPAAVRACVIPRDQLRVDDLDQQLEAEGFDLPRGALGRSAWALEPPAVKGLLETIEAAGAPLGEYVGRQPYRGVVTGCNAAFVIDVATRERLILEDPASEEVIRPFLRGQDVNRWAADWDGQHMIFARRGIDIDAYPAVRGHLETFRTRLEPKPDGWPKGKKWPGRKAGNYEWYELQDAVDYWREFEKPKVIYQVIQYHPSYAHDTSGVLLNDKGFFIPTDDPWVIAVLNSPLMWCRNWRVLTHLKDEALSPLGYLMEQLPIPAPTAAQRAAAEPAVGRLVDLAAAGHAARRELVGWLRAEWGIEKPGRKLADGPALSAEDFLAEVKKRRPKGKRPTPAELAALRAGFEEVAAPDRRRRGEAARLERDPRRRGASGRSA